jgi:hypothetical protein
MLSAGGAPAQVAANAYTLVGKPESYPIAGAMRRHVVAIRVPYGKARPELHALLERVAREQHKKLRSDALMVYAYRQDEGTDGQPSVGRAVIAPFGEWGKAAERGPVRVVVEIEPSYFAGSPARANGTAKRLVTEGATQRVDISRRFESWRPEDVVAEVPVGTTVTILETRTSGPYVTRYRVRLKHRGKTIVGWVHDSEVR